MKKPSSDCWCVGKSSRFPGARFCQADFRMQALGWHAQEGSRIAVPPVRRAREHPRAPTLPRDCARGMSNQQSAPTQHISLSPGRGDAKVQPERCEFGMRRARLPSCSRGLVARLELGAVISGEPPGNAFAVLLLLTWF